MHAGEQRARVMMTPYRVARTDRPTLEVVRTSPAPARIEGKRVADILLTLLLAPVALPLGLFIALAIVLDSRGPVFFSQVRIGRHRRPFRVWKFRSMRADADRKLRQLLGQSPEHAREWAMARKLRNDPRVTRVGRLLRKISLDELPQFWNVLRGDMSVVGPRPIVAEEIPRYGAAFATYTQVRPGVTGLWQVSGRNDMQYSRRVELDCHYIRNRTAAMDLKIVAKTAFVMLRGRGAY